MKRKIKGLLILFCVLAVVFLRAAWIHIPSEGKAIYYVQETGVTIEDALTDEEVTAVRKILFGRIRWSQSVYGYPACGYGEICAIVLDGVYYMPAWDSCGMVAVLDPASGECRYMNVTQRQKRILDSVISSVSSLQ